MKTKMNPVHPMTVNLQKIKEDSIIVLDDVKGMPTDDKPFVSPDYVICIAHRGHIELRYDDMPDYSETHTVGVIFPNHSVCKVSQTDDYLATLVVVDVSMLDNPMLQIIQQMRYRYEPHPCVKLDRHEYKIIMSMVAVMRETSRIDLPEKRMLLMRQLECLLRMLGYYRQRKIGDATAQGRFSELFLTQIAQHFRAHRDVQFYAEQACVTPRYFTTAVRKETGHTPAYWIHRHVVSQAQSLLLSRRDLTVQAVADQLGFADQQTFSRYFKRETSLSPTEYRERNQ